MARKRKGRRPHNAYPDRTLKAVYRKPMSKADILAAPEFDWLTREGLDMIWSAGQRRSSIEGLMRMVKAQLGLECTKDQMRLVLEACHISMPGTRQKRIRLQRQRRAKALMQRRKDKKELRDKFGDQLVRRIFV